MDYHYHPPIHPWTVIYTTGIMGSDGDGQLAEGDVALENALLRQQEGIPESLSVVCGGIRGVLLLDKGKVVYDGENNRLSLHRLPRALPEALQRLPR